MMVMSINLGVVIMGVRVDDLASYMLTLPDQHSRPTSAMRRRDRTALRAPTVIAAQKRPAERPEGVCENSF
jgi:hypothetical protein